MEVRVGQCKIGDGVERVWDPGYLMREVGMPGVHRQPVGVGSKGESAPSLLLSPLPAPSQGINGASHMAEWGRGRQLIGQTKALLTILIGEERITSALDSKFGI